MDQEAADPDQIDEDILTSTVSDEALEAAGIENHGVFCTLVATGCTTETNW